MEVSPRAGLPGYSRFADFTNWAAEEYARLSAPKPEGPADMDKAPPPPCTDPGPLHSPYSLLSKPANTVPWPEPYETMDEYNTYTPPRK